LHAAAYVDPRDILSVSLAGNTVMAHSALKLDPSMIRKEPYVQVAARFPMLATEDFALKPVAEQITGQLMKESEKV